MSKYATLFIMPHLIYNLTRYISCNFQYTKLLLCNLQVQVISNPENVSKCGRTTQLNGVQNSFIIALFGPKWGWKVCCGGCGTLIAPLKGVRMAIIVCGIYWTIALADFPCCIYIYQNGILQMTLGEERCGHSTRYRPWEMETMQTPRNYSSI